MRLALTIGGVWLAVMVLLGIVFSRIGRRLNRHVPVPEDTEDDAPHEPGPRPPHE